MNEQELQIGTRVIKDSGDYTFTGNIVSVFYKKSGVLRYVVENDEGILLIMSPKMIKLDF